MDFSAPALSDSGTFRIIPAHFFSAHPLAAEVDCFSGVSRYTRYPCLRAVANSGGGAPPSHSRTSSFTPSELAEGIVASFHCTNTVPHADEETRTQRHNTTTFLKLMRSTLELCVITVVSRNKFAARWLLFPFLLSEKPRLQRRCSCPRLQTSPSSAQAAVMWSKVRLKAFRKT
jgi:hypothetical protein